MNRARIVLEARKSMEAEGLRVLPLFEMVQIMESVMIFHDLSKGDDVPFAAAAEVHQVLMEVARA